MFSIITLTVHIMMLKVTNQMQPFFKSGIQSEVGNLFVLFWMLLHWSGTVLYATKLTVLQRKLNEYGNKLVHFYIVFAYNFKHYKII